MPQTNPKPPARPTATTDRNEKPIEYDYKMRVRTEFYNDNNEVIHVNRAFFSWSATDHAFHHMQFDRYRAVSCLVFNEDTGRRHAEFAWSKKRELITIFKEDPLTGVPEDAR